MARIKEFKLPDLGEGLTEGEILKWLVAPGDEIRDGQPIVEVETAKAAVEVPSPYTGVVTKLFYDEGTTVDVGQPIIAVDTEPGAGPLDEPEAAAAPEAEADPREGYRAAVQAELTGSVGAEEIEEGKIGGKTSTGRTAVLVGYGVKETTAERRPRRTGGPAAPSAPTPPARVSAATVAEHAAAVAPSNGRAKAKPPVRKLAKDLGVDLSLLHGTGPGGVITRDDVQAAVDGTPATSAPGAVAAPAPRRLAPGERETRVPIKGVRKLTAAAMVSSAFTAPHVTEFITVDVTPMMELRTRLAALPELRDLKVSPLALVAKALLVAVRRNPEVNASWDEAAQEIVVKHYVNLGIAAATPRGLIVPNVKDAQDLSFPELVRALNDLAAVAREGRTAPADMQGGTITITNVGVFGVDNGTPILNPGEAAILCFGAVREMPWVHEGEIKVRQVTQLSLSFDHRMVDGQLGSQFLADLARCLSDPAALIGWS
jgi:2-oxoisovalerate dehydrogenase E2 component (dihydrolipoyl transacylase)